MFKLENGSNLNISILKCFIDICENVWSSLCSYSICIHLMCVYDVNAAEFLAKLNAGHRLINTKLISF